MVVTTIALGDDVTPDEGIVLVVDAWNNNRPFDANTAAFVERPFVVTEEDGVICADNDTEEAASALVRTSFVVGGDTGVVVVEVTTPVGKAGRPVAATDAAADAVAADAVF